MSDFERALKDAKRLAGTAQGQQLAALLQQLGGTDLHQAINRAASGDFAAAQAALTKLMENPQARKILQQLGGKHGA